jgi:hypothetical protein
MYRKHFGLTRHPFAKDLSPDELFLAAAGKELEVRLGHLLELRGIGLVTGEAGSGKTTLVRKVVSALHSGLYRVFYVPLSTGNAMDMYKSIAWELGLPTERSRAALYRVIRAEVTRLCLEAKVRPVLVVDEAQRFDTRALGKIAVEPGRGLFPLGMMSARRFGADRIALVGEAAHVVPPIGAQGLNLGLRDAAAIGELAVAAYRAGRDLGSDDLLARYERMRRADVGSRALTIDVVNRTLLTDFLPAQALRGVGLYMLDCIGPLRRAVMREGIAPRVAEPRLMRGEML